MALRIGRKFLLRIAKYSCVLLLVFAIAAFANSGTSRLLASLVSAAISPNPIAKLTYNRNDGSFSPFSTADESDNNISCIIHQTFKTFKEIPRHWKVSRQSVVNSNPKCEYRFWTDSDIREFISSQYPWFMPTFESYPYNIQRVDAFRYFALYHFGGIYLDLNIGCHTDVSPLSYQYGVVFAETTPFGFSNDFLAARKGHPFYKRVVENLAQWNNWYLVPYLTVLASTGPLFLTLQYHLAKAEREIGDAFALSNADYSNKGAIFYHVHGSTWHSWDVAAYQRVKTVLANGFRWHLFTVVVLLTVGFILYKQRGVNNNAGTGLFIKLIIDK